MAEYSHLEDRIKSLEIQNKDLISKIDKLSKDSLDTKVFETILRKYKEPPGSLYLEPFFTINKINALMLANVSAKLKVI